MLFTTFTILARAAVFMEVEQGAACQGVEGDGVVEVQGDEGVVAVQGERAHITWCVIDALHFVTVKVMTKTYVCWLT